VNVKLWTDGRISGALRDSTGAPLPKIMAQLAALDEDGELVSWSEAVSDEDGRFEFTRLVAGTYVFGVNLDNEPSAAVPFPATRYPAPILLAEGQKLSGIYLRLPPRLPERTIHVQAVWPDGRPAAEVRIEGDCASRSTETDADGRALLQTLAGAGCSILAKARISPGEYARSKTVTVPPGEHSAAVVLALH
jgi:5-hydroxyisourate hydrolase-like protein (transthyretin family)